MASKRFYILHFFVSFKIPGFVFIDGFYTMRWRWVDQSHMLWNPLSSEASMDFPHTNARQKNAEVWLIISQVIKNIKNIFLTFKYTN